MQNFHVNGKLIKNKVEKHDHAPKHPCLDGVSAPEIRAMLVLMSVYDDLPSSS